MLLSTQITYMHENVFWEDQISHWLSKDINTPLFIGCIIKENPAWTQKEKKIVMVPREKK